MAQRIFTVESLDYHLPHLGTKAMHLAEDGALTTVIATGIEETDLVLVRMVQLQGTDLAPWTGIPLLEVMEFSFSG